VSDLPKFLDTKEIIQRRNSIWYIPEPIDAIFDNKIRDITNEFS
jgi:hypothetical protein